MSTYLEIDLWIVNKLCGSVFNAFRVENRLTEVNHSSAAIAGYEFWVEFYADYKYRLKIIKNSLKMGVLAG